VTLFSKLLMIGFTLGLVLPLTAQELPEGPGKKEFDKLCSSCHGPEAVLGIPRMDRDGWAQKVYDMVGPGTGEQQQAEVKAVIDYLGKYVSPGAAKPPASRKLNVNQASAKDLESGLSLSPAAAEALVKYRQANGNFKDLADLKKALTAITAKIADDQKEILAF
jgi:hypothetical protein